MQAMLGSGGSCCQQTPGVQGAWGTRCREGLCVRKLKERFTPLQASLTPRLASHQPVRPRCFLK